MKKVRRVAGRSPALARQQPLAQTRTEGRERWTSVRYLRGRIVEVWRDLAPGDHLNVRNEEKRREGDKIDSAF